MNGGARAAAWVLCVVPPPHSLEPSPLAGLAHPPPAAVLELEIEDHSVVLRLTAWQEQFERWLDGPVPVSGGLDLLQRAECAQRTAKWLQADDVLWVDGAATSFGTSRWIPQEELEHAHGYPIACAELHSTLDEPARNVTLHWKRFDELDDADSKLPVILAVGGTLRPLALRPEEPAYTWHAERWTPRAAPSLRAPGKSDAAHEGVRLPAFVLGGTALSIAAVLAFRRSVSRTGWGFATILTALAIGFSGVRTPVPWGPPPVEIPATVESLNVFGTLLENVYAAFGANSENEIYDTLATSVSPALVDRMYGDVYESLILREDGGAVCSVEELDLLDCYRLLDREPPPGPPSFRIDAGWRVRGQVLHFGHLHERVQRYRAVFRVEHDGISWKLAEQIPLEAVRESAE